MNIFKLLTLIRSTWILGYIKLMSDNQAHELIEHNRLPPHDAVFSLEAHKKRGILRLDTVAL